MARKGIDSRYHDYLINNNHKKAVIITGRVNAGDSQASYCLEGIVNFLLSDNQEAIELRANYIIYVVPMINIDGVMNGNKITNMAGIDLNQQWQNPSPYLAPVIFAIKQLMNMVKAERDIEMYFDLQSHDKSSCSYVHGNSWDGQGSIQKKYESNAKLRLIPYMLTQMNNHFQIDKSIFNLELNTATSAHQVLCQQFRIK